MDNIEEQIEEQIEAQEEAWEEAMEKNHELPDGLAEGKVVSFPVADSKAVYEVVEVGEKVSIVEKREDLMLDPGYYSDAVDHETGEVLTSTLRDQINREERLHELFDK